MSTEMTVAFIILAVWSAVFTAAYIGERYRNRKLRNALKKKRSRYIREVSYVFFSFLSPECGYFIRSFIAFL